MPQRPVPGGSLLGPATKNQGASDPGSSRAWPLSDTDIRVALREALMSQPDLGNARVLEEVRIPARSVRADLMITEPRFLHVVEIKSDLDSLERLRQQIAAYESVGDFVSIVVGWRHAARTLREVPGWWEVLLAERGAAGGVRLVQLREGSPNPVFERPGLPSLLSRQESLDLLKACGSGHGLSRSSRRVINSLVGEVVTHRALRERVHRCLKAEPRLSVPRPQSCDD